MKIILRGEIWRVRFDPIEDSGIGNTMPALVLQNDLGNRYSNTTIVAAITGRIKDLPTLVDVDPRKSNGLKLPCAIYLSHIRTVSQSRLIARIGRLEDIYMPRIELALSISCGFRLGTEQPGADSNT